MLLFKTYLFIKSIKQQYKNRKLKIITSMWNDEFELPEGFFSLPDIQDYIKDITKKQETLTTIPRIHVYINRINNRLAFKIKNGYKLELQTPETMKLFENTKKINRQNKKWRKCAKS